YRQPRRCPVPRKPAGSWLPGRASTANTRSAVRRSGALWRRGEWCWPTLQAGIAGALDVFGCAIDAKGCTVGAAHLAEFGGQHDFIAARFQDLSEQPFVGADAVHVGGVEEID